MNVSINLNLKSKIIFRNLNLDIKIVFKAIWNFVVQCNSDVKYYIIFGRGKSDLEYNLCNFTCSVTAYIEQPCGNFTCYNGGSCLNSSSKGLYCMCAAGFYGEFCKSNSSSK